MANFDASLAATTVTMNDNNHVNHATQLVNTASVYTWTTGSGFDITVTSFLGNIVAAPAAAPTAGTVNRIEARDAADAPLYVVSGLNAPLAPMVLNRAAYWKAILAGKTQLFAPDDQAFQGFGDVFAVNAGTITGGADTYTGGSAAVAVQQDFQGDAFEMDGGTLKGGADVINSFGAGELIGDVKFLSAGTATGGNDKIALNGAVDDAGNGTTTRISGDTDTIGPTARLIAGNDTITISNALTISGDISGDVFSGADGADIDGGDDSITTTGITAMGNVFGDVSNAVFDATGGNDTLTIHGLALSIGGDFNTVSGTATGGNDTLVLSVGAVNALVSGDAQTVAVGGNLTGGNDSIDAAGVTVALRTAGDALTAEESTVIGGDDTITGTALNDILSGDVDVLSNSALTGGDDIVNGGSGNDEIYGEAHQLQGGPTFNPGGNDTLDGGAGNDTLNGQMGNDILIGGAGNDTLDGGGIAGQLPGTDTAAYTTLALSVSVDLQAGIATGQGTDTLLNIRNVRGSSEDDAIAGNADANNLTGNNGDDALFGRAQNDTLNGGDGNDTLFGGSGNDTLTGAAGNDELRGEGGNNSMTGGAGNDRYFVDSTGDVINPEAAASGTDTVFSTISLTLGANIEILLLQGSAGLSGTGNELANRVEGNAGANPLQGAAGNDTLNGKDGADTLTGGGGNDTMTGGAAADVFRFAAVNGGADRIEDFSKAIDRFDLSGGSFSARTIAGADTILTHSGGTIRVVGVNDLTLAQWNGLVLGGGGASDRPIALHDSDGAGTVTFAWPGSEIVHLPGGDWFYA